MSINPYAIPGVMRMEVRSSTVSRILDILKETYGVTYNDLRLPTRKTDICVPRQLAMYWIKYLCPDITLKDTGRMFDKDHATVLHAIKVIKNRANDFKVHHYFNQSVDAFNVLMWDVHQRKNYN